MYYALYNPRGRLAPEDTAEVLEFKTNWHRREWLKENAIFNGVNCCHAVPPENKHVRKYLEAKPKPPKCEQLDLGSYAEMHEIDKPKEAALTAKLNSLNS